MVDNEWIILGAVICYAIGYWHKTAVNRSMRKSIPDWLTEAVGDSAKFGIIMMAMMSKEDELVNKLDFQVEVNDEKVNVLIEKVA